MNRVLWTAGLRLTVAVIVLVCSVTTAPAQTGTGTTAANACGDITGTPVMSNFGGTLSAFSIERRVPVSGFSSVDTLSFPSGTLQSVQGGALEFRERLIFNAQNGRLTSTLFTQQPAATFPTPLGTSISSDTLQTFAIQVDRVYTGQTPHPSVMFAGRVVANDQRGPFGNLNCAPASVSVSFPRQTTGTGGTGTGGTGTGGTGTGGTGTGGTGTGGTTDTSIANVVVVIAGQVTTYSTTAGGTVTVSTPPTTPGGGTGGGGTPTGPTANAGAERQQAVTQVYALSGTASSAGPSGGALTYLWRLVPGSKSASLTNPTSATPQIIFGEGFGDYVVELIVTNASGVASAPARITISYSGN